MNFEPLRPLPETSGLLNIYKPSGCTSFQVIQAIRRILKEKRVGHCGTLDPMAEGVLLVLFGRATSASSRLMGGEKTYWARVQLGIKTDSGDVTGRVIERADHGNHTENALRECLQGFVGEIDQTPPMISAIKFNGRKLYQYARAGIEVYRPARTVSIFALDFLSYSAPMIEIRVRCSKGTYIRTLAEDIGARLGVPATLASLVRERVGEHCSQSSLRWDRIQAMDRVQLLESALPVSL